MRTALFRFYETGLSFISASARGLHVHQASSSGRLFGGDNSCCGVGKGQHLTKLRFGVVPQPPLGHMVQHPAEEGIACAGGRNGDDPQAGHLGECFAAVGLAVIRSQGELDQTYLRELLQNPPDACVKILLTRQPDELVVGDLQNIGVGKAIEGPLPCGIQIGPQVHAQIGIEGTQNAFLLCDSNRPNRRSASPGKGPAFGAEDTSGSHTANGAAHPLPV